MDLPAPFSPMMPWIEPCAIDERHVLVGVNGAEALVDADEFDGGSHAVAWSSRRNFPSPLAEARWIASEHARRMRGLPPSLWLADRALIRRFGHLPPRRGKETETRFAYCTGQVLSVV